MNHSVGMQRHQVLLMVLAMPALCGCPAEVPGTKHEDFEYFDVQTVELDLLEPPFLLREMLHIEAADEPGPNRGAGVPNPDILHLADAVIQAGEQSRAARDAFEAAVRDVLRVFDETPERSRNVEEVATATKRKLSNKQGDES